MRGIYKIQNKINGKVYIGESLDVEHRWYQHKHKLNASKHNNKYLQSDWNTYGESSFSFEALKILGDDIKEPLDKYILLVYEDILIRKYNSLEIGYNIEDTLTDLLLGVFHIGKSIEDDRKILKSIISFFRKNNNDIDLCDKYTQDLINNISTPYKSVKRYTDAIASLYGNYYFFNYEQQRLWELSSATLIRFLYLCCYMTYNSYLTTNREKLMTTKDLGNVLNLGKNSTNTTKNILMKYKMINLKCDDTFKVNTKYCSKGASLRPNTNKIRIFTKPLKELYKKANPREHVQLDLLYRMIPYLHFSTNICCKNPYEIDIDKIEPYSLKELASLIHETNTTRFKRKLLDTTVSNEHVLQVLRFNSKQAIAVNPRICFKGNYNDAIALADYGIHFK